MIKYEIRAKAWVSGALVQVVAVCPLSWKCIPGGVPFSHLVAAQTEMRIWNKMMWCLNKLKKYQGLYCASFPCIFAQLWCENIIKFYLDTFFFAFFFSFSKLYLLFKIKVLSEIWYIPLPKYRKKYFLIKSSIHFNRTQILLYYCFLKYLILNGQSWADCTWSRWFSS